MAVRIFTEGKLSDSEILKGLNEWNEGSGNQIEKANKIIQTGKKLTVEEIEPAYVQIKQLSHTLTRAALQSFTDGNTILIYTDTKSKAFTMTEALPFIVLKNPTDGSYKSYIFMDKYITKSRDGILKLQSQILRDLLEGSFISLKMKTNDFIGRSQSLQQLLMKMYTNFVYRILNKEYSIGADRIINDTLKYWINRFALEHIIGSKSTPESKESMAKEHFKFIDEMKYADIKKHYDYASPSFISGLLYLISLCSPRMKGLTLRTFASSWISYYHNEAMLAIDTLDYLIFMIICLQSGNPLLNTSAGEIVKETKGINIFREELIKLI